MFVTLTVIISISKTIKVSYMVLPEPYHLLPTLLNKYHIHRSQIITTSYPPGQTAFLTSEWTNYNDGSGIDNSLALPNPSRVEGLVIHPDYALRVAASDKWPDCEIPLYLPADYLRHLHSL